MKSNNGLVGITSKNGFVAASPTTYTNIPVSIAIQTGSTSVNPMTRKVKIIQTALVIPIKERISVKAPKAIAAMLNAKNIIPCQSPDAIWKYGRYNHMNWKTAPVIPAIRKNIDIAPGADDHALSFAIVDDVYQWGI